MRSLTDAGLPQSSVTVSVTALRQVRQSSSRGELAPDDASNIAVGPSSERDEDVGIDHCSMSMT